MWTCGIEVDLPLGDTWMVWVGHRYLGHDDWAMRWQPKTILCTSYTRFHGSLYFTQKIMGMEFVYKHDMRDFPQCIWDK